MHDFRFLIRDEWPWEIRAAIRKAADGDAMLTERTLSCVRMFRAIICRAIADAYGKTGLEDPTERKSSVREAREFFHRQDEDFVLVFSCAGIDPKAILPHMLKLAPEDYPCGQSTLDDSGNLGIVPEPQPKRRRK